MIFNIFYKELHISFPITHVDTLVIDEGWTHIKSTAKQERFCPESTSTPTKTSNRYSTLYIDDDLECSTSDTVSSDESCHNSELSSTDSQLNGRLKIFNSACCSKIHQ